MKIEEQVATRHVAVAEIVRRHLEALYKEILRYDKDTLNIDGAADKAEVAHQVLTELVTQLRGFSEGARHEIREDERLYGT